MATKKIYLDNALIAQNTASYNDLYALPSINGVTLQGEVTSDELGLYSKEQVDELIAASKNIKVVPAAPSTPLPNTQYYVGPGADGSYHIYIYDTNLNRIDLGTTGNMDMSAYQEKQPFVLKPDGSKRYDIGHNDGDTDNRTLTNHTVAGAINELDTKLQSKQDKDSNDLQTSKKNIVEAINETKSRIDGMGDGVKVYHVPYSSEILRTIWQPIATITFDKTNKVSQQSSVSANFLLAPDWEGHYGGLASGNYTAPVQLQLNVQYSNGYLCSTYRPLTALLQNQNCTCLRYGEKYGAYLLVSWADNVCRVWYYDTFKDVGRPNQKLRVIVLDQDVGDHMTLQWCNGAATQSDPKGTNYITYNWKQLGYNYMVYA